MWNKFHEQKRTDMKMLCNEKNKKKTKIRLGLGKGKKEVKRIENKERKITKKRKV